MVSRLTTHGNCIGLVLLSQLFTLPPRLFLIFPSSPFQSSSSPPSSVLILLILLFLPLYTLIIYLFLLSLLLLLLLLLILLLLLLLLLMLLPLHPILPLQHFSSSQHDFIFSFWLSTLFLLLILLYFNIHLLFFPLLFLSSTSVVLHILSLNHIFILQSFFSSYYLISLLFRLIFHSFLFATYSYSLFFFFASKSHFWFTCRALLVMLTWLEQTTELFGRWILFASVLYGQSVVGLWLGCSLHFAESTLMRSPKKRHKWLYRQTTNTF